MCRAYIKLTWSTEDGFTTEDSGDKDDLRPLEEHDEDLVSGKVAKKVG